MKLRPSSGYIKIDERRGLTVSQSQGGRMRPEPGGGVGWLVLLLLDSVRLWQPIRLTAPLGPAIQRRSGLVADNNQRKQPRPQPQAPYVQEVQLKWSEEIQTEEDENTTEDQRGKRFLDPDDIADHMEDHDHDHDPELGVKVYAGLYSSI